MSPVTLAEIVVWQSEGLVLVDKPAGVLSQPAGGVRRADATQMRRPGYAGHSGQQPASEGPNLVDLARAHFAQDTVAVLHRLDRNVSGLVMLATRKEQARAMSAAFARGEVDRRYVAIVRGTPPADSLVIDAWLDKDEERNVVRARDADAITEAERAHFVAARTEVRVEERFSALFGRGAAVEARPITGRSHQIRVHLAHVGLPIVGDAKYGVRVKGLDRPLLHAREIRFTHPTTHENVAIRAPEPWSRAEVRSLRRFPVTGGHAAARRGRKDPS